LNSKSAKKGKFTLNLGGDHSMATGSIHGLRKVYKSLKIVWVDAHADINTLKTSPTGNFHGMPMSPLLGLMKASTIPGHSWLKKLLKPKDIVYIGLRDLDEGEKKIIKKLKIKTFTMDDVTGMGIGKVMKKIFNHFGKDGFKHPIHCSFDVDGIDPSHVM